MVINTFINIIKPIVYFISLIIVFPLLIVEGIYTAELYCSKSFYPIILNSAASIIYFMTVFIIRLDCVDEVARIVILFCSSSMVVTGFVVLFTIKEVYKKCDMKLYYIYSIGSSINIVVGAVLAVIFIGSCMERNRVRTNRVFAINPPEIEISINNTQIALQTIHSLQSYSYPYCKHTINFKEETGTSIENLQLINSSHISCPVCVEEFKINE